MIPKLEKLRYEKINLSIISLSSFNNYSDWVAMYECLQFKTTKVQLRLLTFIVILMLQIFVIFELLLILLIPPVINLIIILYVSVLKS